MQPAVASQSSRSRRNASMTRIVVVGIVLAVALFGVARVSAVGADTPADVVYIATGSDFPDALGVSAVAALNNGPVLFVLKDAIPAATLSELNRLQPSRIVIVGGTGVVSTAVENALKALNFAPTVERLAGADRFATAAAISQEQFPSDPTETFVLPASAMAPAFNDTPLANNGKIWSLTDGNVVCAVGNVDVPNGATITELRIIGVDNSATRFIESEMYRQNFDGSQTFMGSAESSVAGTPGETVASDTTIASPVVDLSDGNYVVFGCADGTVGVTEVIQIEVDYTP